MRTVASIITYMATVCLATYANAQTRASSVPWPGSGWTIDAEQSRTERYLGRESLFVQNGEVWLDAAGLHDGVVEFDVAMTGEQGFHGLIFRARDHRNYETVYLRPHQTGRPDATQYQPVFNGVTGWQIYSTARYALPVSVATDRWVHVRATIHDRRLELQVDGETLVFPHLLREAAAGGIAVSSSGAPARFANVSVRPGASPPPEGGEGAPADPVPEGIVPRWRVSEPFAESRVDVTSLRLSEWAGLKWSTLEAAERGIANIAMLHPRAAEANTVFAAVTLRAATAGPIRVRFGFSDRVAVFLNGVQLFRGNDTYRTRDYRFLGTVGLFDELILPLKRGDNQLWFAVSEDFGGWAVTLQLPETGSVQALAPK